MLTNPIFGQQLEDVFAEELMTAYEKAIDFNESKNYLGAYQQILLAENDMDAALTGKNISPFALKIPALAVVIYSFAPIVKVTLIFS